MAIETLRLFVMESESGPTNSTTWQTTLVGGSWTAAAMYYNDITYGPNYAADPEDYTAGIGHNGKDINGIFLEEAFVVGNYKYAFYYVPFGGLVDGVGVDVANRAATIRNWGAAELGSNHLVDISGPYFYGGNMYVVCRRDAKPHGVYKSTDSGATWTEQDTIGFASGFAAFHYVEADNTIYFVRAQSGSYDVDLIDFDLTTDTYNSPHDTATLDFGAGPPGDFVGIRKLTTGDIRVFYVKTGSPTPTLVMRMSTLSGGVWTDVQLSTADKLLTGRVEIDAYNRCHLFYRDQVTGPPTQTYAEIYIGVDEDGTIGSEETLPGSGSRAYQTHPIIWNGSIYNVGTSDDSGSGYILHLIEGTPLSAPTWTDSEIIHTQDFFASPPNYGMNCYALVVTEVPELKNIMFTGQLLARASGNLF